MSASRPARPRLATPPCAPTRPACDMSGFLNRPVIYMFCSWFWKKWRNFCSNGSCWCLRKYESSGCHLSGSIRRRPVPKGTLSVRRPAMRRFESTRSCYVIFRDSKNIPTQYSISKSSACKTYLLKKIATVESKTRVYHRRIDSGAYRGGGAKRIRTGRRQNNPNRRQAYLALLKHRRYVSLSLSKITNSRNHI